MNDIIKDWPQESREAAQLVIDTYGEPDEITESMIVWHQPGPWKRMIAYRAFDQHAFPAPHIDAVESIIEHHVPEDKYDALAMFDGSVTVRKTAGEISAKCHDEQANLLALNLANDIITGEKNVQEARDYYKKEFLDYRRGQPTPYMSELQFTPTGEGDPGERNISDDELEQAKAEGSMS